MKKETITIFLNTLYQIAGKALTSGIGLVVTMLLTRYLGVLGFGEYSFVFNFVGFILIFADLGLTTLLTREIAAKRADDQYIANVFTLRLLATSLFLLLGNIMILFLPYSPMIKIGVLLASISNIFLFQSGPIWSIFQARLQFDKAVIPQIITSIVNGLLILFGIFLHSGLLFFIAVNIVATVIGFFISLWTSHIHSLFAASKKAFIEIITEAWPLGVGVLVTVAYFKIDSLLLSLYYNPSTLPDVGYYAVAYKIFEVVLVFGGFFSQTLYPFFSKNIYEKSFIRNVKKYFVYTTLLAVFATFFMYILSPLLVTLIGGEKFIPSIAATQILSLSAGVSILGGFFLSIAIAGNKQLLVLKLSVVALIGNIMMNIFIIPHYSFIGTSWTTFVTQVYILIANIYVSYVVVSQRKVNSIHDR